MVMVLKKYEDIMAKDKNKPNQEIIKLRLATLDNHDQLAQVMSIK